MRINAYDKVRAEYLLSLRDASNFIAANLTSFESAFVYISLLLVYLVFVGLFVQLAVLHSEPSQRVSVSKHKSSFLSAMGNSPHFVLYCVFLTSSTAFFLFMSQAPVRIPTSSLIFFSASVVALMAFSFVATFILLLFLRFDYSFKLVNFVPDWT